MQSKSESTINNYLKALKRFFRDFLGRPEVVGSFRFKRPQVRAKRVPSKEELKRFYEELPNLWHRVAFLVYASSGLRAKEVTSVTWEDVDLEQRRIYPAKCSSLTKKVGFGFFNSEAYEALLALKESMNPKESDAVFPSYRTIEQVWRRASKRCGVKVSPKVLREWFCCEMGSLGVPDRYIDAFCGRVPRSVLARHYTDYSPEKLKAIYEEANLRVLG